MNKPSRRAKKEALPRRRAFVKALLKDRGDLLVVAGLGSSAWDITAAGDHPNNFPLWGAMGGAAVLGLGLALAQPKRRVLVVTGDGEMLMGLGSLATIAAQAPRNLSVVVLDNQMYGETGRQATHTAASTDLAAVARAAGIARSFEYRRQSDAATLRREIDAQAGPVFAVVKIDPEPLALVLPPRDGAYLKNRFRVALLGGAALEV